MMRLVVDRDRCQGIGLCELTAGDLIEVGDDSQSHVLVDELAPEHLQAAQVAVANCPTEALLLRE